MKIFLTGATGFIGKHVFEKIYAEGHAILLLSKDVKPGTFGFKSFSHRVLVQRGDLQNIETWSGRVKKLSQTH